MPKRLHSILRLQDKFVPDDCGKIVVCETQQDEKDVIRNATNAGMKITSVGTFNCGIFLNDFTS